MDYVGALFVDSVLNLVSVFSQPIILLPVVSCILFGFLHFLFFSLIGRGSK